MNIAGGFSHRVAVRGSVLLLAFLAGFVGTYLPLAFAESPHVDVLRVKGAVTPILASYIDRGISQAEQEQAEAAVIQLDTPGGLDNAMRDIVQRIVASRVPVVVYVAPAGARSASAGAFITIASHVAAMAPNTAIGAAHPVGQGGEEIQGPLGDKVTNDAVAYIKSLATERNRNVDWAESAVRQSISSTEREALSQNVVDLVAPDMETLLKEIDGRRVKLATGEVTLKTRDASIRYVDMNFAESFLFTITDPNIAFILLSLALTAIFLELSNPGAILPGVVGGILLLLAFFALGTLPVNYAGVLLIALAFLFFLAEIWVTSHGMLAVGGAISLTLGGLILFSGASPAFRVDWPVLVGVVGSITGFFVFVVAAIVQGQRRRATTGHEGLLNRTAIARTELNPEGFVFLDGERWHALSEDGRIESGEEVLVKKVEGMRLTVGKPTKVQQKKEAS